MNEMTTAVVAEAFTAVMAVVIGRAALYGLPNPCD
jgi:hypothetical protein